MVLVWCCVSGSLLRSVMDGELAATAEAVSVCVGHRQNDRSGIRRGSRVLSPETDYEDRFDSHVQHHPKDVRITERPLLDSHSRRRRVSRDPSCPAGDRYNMVQREEITYPDDDDACMSPLGAGSRIRSSQANFALSRSHRASGSRSARDGGHVQRG